MKFNVLKRGLCWLTLAMLPLLSIAGNGAGTLFSKGNALYAKGQYKEALAAYQQLVDEGYQSPGVYFNMGNASYKNDDLASAVLYYEKAHKLAPGDDDINYNLKYVNLKTTDKIEEVPEFFLTRWWHGLILSFSTQALAVWSIIFVLLGSAILVLYFFTGSTAVKKTSFYGFILFFFLGVLAIFMANRQLSYFEDHREAIVFRPSVNVKSGPVEQSNTLFVIHDGTKVNVLDNNNGWTKISLSNGNEGWIKQLDIREI
ncbi:MAG TPA: tetratricopeptide repeat protein [Mucilaginibacter sp.]|nr:tetratricopeptide repeat protein [Mucilaginibacter sp.]